ncbi:single hybrid motif-containing protein, partial [Baffinella frigidus]
MPRGTHIANAAWRRLILPSSRLAPRSLLHVPLPGPAASPRVPTARAPPPRAAPASQRQRALSSAPAAATPDGLVAFNLADIGEGIAEVEVLQWFVSEGDHVDEFDRVCEVQSDKATVEISSRYRGHIVKICHAVGGVARVGNP